MYQFVSDDWSDAQDASKSIFQKEQGKKSTLPVAIETEAAFVFRELSGTIFHRYPFPGTGHSPILTHYFNYLIQESPEWLTANTSKGILIRQLFFLVLTLSRLRKKINILEVGSTIGENYLFIKEFIRKFHLDLEVYFVGVDIYPDLCQFSRLVHNDDPRFHVIATDGANLERFPNQGFDITICNGVANLVNEPQRAFAEIIRVTRVASVFSYQVTRGAEPLWLTQGETGTPHYIPTREWLLETWRPYGAWYDYCYQRWDFSRIKVTAGGSGYYLNQEDADLDIQMEYHTMSKIKLD